MTLLQRTLHQAEILDENPDLLEWYLHRRGPRLAEFLDRSPEFFEWYLLGRGHQKGPLEKFVDRHPAFISSYLSHHNRPHAFGRVVEKHPKLLEDYLLNRKPVFEQFADNHSDYIKRKPVLVQFLDKHTDIIDEYLKQRPVYLTNHLHYYRLTSVYIPPSFFTVPPKELFNFIEDLPALNTLTPVREISHDSPGTGCDIRKSTSPAAVQSISASPAT